MAFLVSGHTYHLDEAQKTQMQWDAVQARAREFVRQHPGAASLQDISKEMAK
ncbi:hypothetical protein D3C71_2201450 [compost metagenome]